MYNTLKISHLHDVHQVNVFKGGLVEVPSLEPDGLSGLGQALLLLGAQVDVTVLGGAKSRERIQFYLISQNCKHNNK